ncbi:transcriptional regulator [Martelella mangrovi]|uniref:transcriptional regulator n=1 Tax=Martelella mangrovi TaxID=1397477 RepID=UPI0033980B6A
MLAPFFEEIAGAFFFEIRDNLFHGAILACLKNGSHSVLLKIQLDLTSVVLNISDMEHLLAYLNGERGRRVALANALHLQPSAISQWRDVPPTRVLAIEKATGISRHSLRPDIYGPLPQEAAQ